MDKLLVKDFGQKYSDKHKPPAATMRYPPALTKLDGTSLKEQSPPPWATAPKPVLPPNAPTAGYLCGGSGIMTAGFETAGIRSLWNIDQDNSDPFLSQAIAQIYQTNFHHPVIRQTLQKVAASDRFNDLPTPDILVLTQRKQTPLQKQPQSQRNPIRGSGGAGGKISDKVKVNCYRVSFSHKKAEVPPAIQESTSNKKKRIKF